MEELLHKALMYERQLKKKVSKQSYGTSKFGYSKSEKQGEQKEYKPFEKPKSKEPDLKGKGKVETRTRELKCFKCHGVGHYASECINKRVMVLKENGEFESEDESPVQSSESEAEQVPKGKVLVTIRSLSVIAKTDQQLQRENLFHSRCLVKDKVCSFIIDGGSCTNVASEYMVRKLGLEELPHPRPYKLNWLNERGELAVDKQVKVLLSIGKYEDEVMCDVLPMDASHILLGRPWQSDRRVTHNGYSNCYSFDFKGRKVKLAPMTPHEVYLDQISMKENRSQPTEASKALTTETSSKGSTTQSSNLLFVHKDSIDTTNLGQELPSIIKCLSQVSKEESQEEEHKSFPSIVSEQQISPVPILESTLIDKPQKHCKEIDLVRIEPSLFVMVSAQDEKRFGLEKVKEFCVSKSVFESIIPTFEKLTPETFIRPNGYLIDELHEYHSSLSVSEFNDISDLIRARTEPMLFKTFSNVKQSLDTGLCISKSLYECRNHVESVLSVLGHKSLLKYHNELFKTSCHTFDVFALVFVKAHKGQVKEVVSNTRKRKLIFKENQVKFRSNHEWLSPKAIKFKWKEKEEMSCQLEKEKFFNTLMLFDFFKSCKLEYYASRNGIGTILMQDYKPIVAFNEKNGGFPLGVTKSFTVMKDHFLWPHKKKGDVERRCQSYLICKLTTSKPHGLHHSVPIPLHSWNEISIGYVKLPRIMMHKDFLVLIMNMLSKLIHFVSLDKTSVKLHHAHLMFEGITRLHSFLKIKLGLLDAFHEFEHSLSDPVFSNDFASCLSVFHFNEAFMLFRTESKFVWYKVLSKMKLMLKFALCAFKWFNKLEKYLGSVLKYISRGLKDLSTLIAYFCRTCDVFLVVFVDFYKEQDSHHGEGRTRTNPFRWRKSDLDPGDGILSKTHKRFSNRANSTKRQGKYNVSETFNVADLLPFVSDKADLRTNPFEEGGDDIRMEQQQGPDLEALDEDTSKLEPEEIEAAMELSSGPLTRSKAKKLNEAVSTLLVQAQSNLSALANPTTLVVIQAA